MNKKARICLIGMILLTLHSCVLYRPYEQPCVEMPEHWRTSSDETSTVINAQWWQQLNDCILDALIEEALNNNQDLRLATARIAEFRARLGIVSSQLYPQINAQATFTRQRFSQTLFGQNAPFGNQESPPIPSEGDLPPGCLPSFNQMSPITSNFRTVINAALELDIWGKIRSATDAALADLLGEVEARRTVILTLVTSVAAAYIQLRQYDQQLAVSQQTLTSREESYRLAKIRFVEGLTSELEVKQAASEREEAALEVIRFQTLIPQQENLLSVLVGYPPSSIQRGRAVDEWNLPPQVPAGLPADLLEQRPDILQAEDRLIATHARIGEARALYFPSISLTGYYGYESSELRELFTNPSRVWQWAVNLLQPIFTGGRISSTVDLAEAQEQEALANYRQVILTALQQVDDALVGHQNSKESLEVEYRRVQDLKDYLRLARLQYENGQIDYLNVLDAERRLFGAQLDLAQAQAAVFLTLINLYRALGGGWVVDAENLIKQDEK